MLLSCPFDKAVKLPSGPGVANKLVSWEPVSAGEGLALDGKGLLGFEVKLVGHWNAKRRSSSFWGQLWNQREDICSTATSYFRPIRMHLFIVDGVGAVVASLNQEIGGPWQNRFH